MRFNTELSRKRYIYGSQLISLIFILMMLLTPAWAAQVSLTWDPNSEPNISGYKMHYGLYSRNYQYSTNLGNVTTCTISDLQEGKTYYFAVSTYNTDNIESDFSDEVAYTVPASGSSVMTWLEAEDGDLYAPMQRATDSNASSGEYIRVTSGSGGYSEYFFDIPESGTYFIWGRVLGPSEAMNSFYISTDDGGDVLWHITASTNWVWDQALSTYFTAGQHTLKIRQREYSAQLDKILITNSPGYVPQGLGGETTPQIWFEAEDGDLYAPMQRATDSNASSGEYIRVTSGSGGYSEYFFDIPESGTYFIWGRVLGPTEAMNSFYISTDDGGDVTWHIPVSTSWVWDQALSANFAAGLHTLTLKQREYNTQLDKIFIANDPEYIPR